MPDDRRRFLIVPLYDGRPPYYSATDVTQELFPARETLSSTQELPVHRDFFEKWKLWIIGVSLVVVLSTAVIVGTVGCCSNAPSNYKSPIVPQFPFQPAPKLPAKTPTGSKKCPTCSGTTTRVPARPPSSTSPR